MIDLKHLLVIANNGSSKGYQRILGKSGQAAAMADWYYGKNWSVIEPYVRKEAKDFVRAYSILKKEIPKIVLVCERLHEGHPKRLARQAGMERDQ